MMILTIVQWNVTCLPRGASRYLSGRIVSYRLIVGRSVREVDHCYSISQSCITVCELYRCQWYITAWELTGHYCLSCLDPGEITELPNHIGVAHECAFMLGEFSEDLNMSPVEHVWIWAGTLRSANGHLTNDSHKVCSVLSSCSISCRFPYRLRAGRNT